MDSDDLAPGPPIMSVSFSPASPGFLLCGPHAEGSRVTSRSFRLTHPQLGQPSRKCMPLPPSRQPRCGNHVLDLHQSLWPSGKEKARAGKGRTVWRVASGGGNSCPRKSRELLPEEGELLLGWQRHQGALAQSHSKLERPFLISQAASPAPAPPPVF